MFDRRCLGGWIGLHCEEQMFDICLVGRIGLHCEEQVFVVGLVGQTA